jgi:hypothetical protein
VPRGKGFEGSGKLLVDAVESAVGEKSDDVAGGKLGDQICHNGVDIFVENGGVTGLL